MSESLELVATNGPLTGQRFQVSSAEGVAIGRSTRGIHIPDPLVSVDHAEISYASDRFWISDLRSHTGTLVNGERLGEDPVPLEPGAEVVIGESTFVVEELEESAPWTLPVLGFLFFVVVVAALLSIFATKPIGYRPALTSAEPVRQGDVTSRRVDLPLKFVRKHGRDHRGVRLRRVTDFDGDGVDEVWLGLGAVEQIWTFAADGVWKPLGEVPSGCTDRPGLTFPELSCGGAWYQFRDGAYRATGQDGVVVWLPPGAAADAGPAKGAPAKKKRGPATGPEPLRVSLQQRDRLAGFLAARGVTEPVHYILCEGVIPGARAQVLTASGRLAALDYGCIRGVGLTGPRSKDLGSGPPVAVAFTAAGHQALLDDLKIFLGGDVDGLFFDAAGRGLTASFAAGPESQIGMVRVTFDADEASFDPIAPERQLSGLRRLIPSEGHEPAPLVTTATVLSPGVFKLDPPGCSELEVEIEAWHCLLARWCLPSRPFATVREVGCGDERVIAQAPYRGGVVAAKSGDVEVRLRVDALGGSGQIDVLRTRVAWRSAEQGSTPPHSNEP